MNEENEEFEREMNYKSPSQVEGDLVAREFADGQNEDYSEYSFCCGAKYINPPAIPCTEEVYKSALCSECKSSEHTGR